MQNKVSFLGFVSVITLLSACSSSYQANVNNQGFGYSEQQVSGKSADYFELIYQGKAGDSADANRKHWQKRADELCPNGYRVVNYQQSMASVALQSNDTGNMYTLAKQRPIAKGEIACQ